MSIIDDKIIDPKSKSQKSNCGINLTIDKIEKFRGIAIFKDSSGPSRPDLTNIKEVATYKEYIDNFLKNSGAESLNEIRDQMKEIANLANDPFTKALFGLDKKEKFKDSIDLNQIDLMFDTFEAVKNDNLDSYYLKENNDYLVTFEQGIKYLEENEYFELKILDSYSPYILLYREPYIDLANHRFQNNLSTIIRVGQIPVVISKGIPLVNLTLHSYNNKRG